MAAEDPGPRDGRGNEAVRIVPQRSSAFDRDRLLQDVELDRRIVRRQLPNGAAFLW